MYNVFISYRREGGFETAKHISDLLARDGYKVSFDIDSLRGGPFDEQLYNRIDQCKDFILIVDPKAFERTCGANPIPKENDWLRCELAYALKQRKHIIPIFLYGVDSFPDNLPDDVAKVCRMNGLKCNHDYFDAFYKRLKSYLKTKNTKFIFWGIVLIVVAILLLIIYSLGYKNTQREKRIKEFVELYCDATNHHNIPEIEKLYASEVQQYYKSYNIGRDSVMNCHRNYENKFKAHNPTVIVDWNTLKTELTKDGFISLTFTESFTLEREEDSKCTMWIIDKHFLLDKDYKIVKEYEEIKKSK